MDAPETVYEDLFALVCSKDYFVITTNVDHCFQKAGFDKKRLFYTQGDYGLFQCMKPCCQETVDNENVVRQMVLSQGCDASVGFPKFKSKKKPVRSYTTNCVNGNIVLQNGKLKLPKAGWVRIRQHRKIDEGYQLKGATITQEADERYYVALLYSCEKSVNEIKKTESVIDLDFSMKELYVDSNGNHAAYPHFFQKSQQKLARKQCKLSHCEHGSNRYKKQKKKIARIHTHIAHQRKDFLHKESRKIANSYDIVCIENLNMKEMSQDMHLGKSVHDNGWGIFTDFLEYKMKRAGKKLIHIDR